MTSSEIRALAEDNLAFILERARQNEGRMTPDDVVQAQTFCRVVEAETNGGPYGVTTYINGANREGVLAAAARAVHSETPQ